MPRLALPIVISATDPMKSSLFKALDSTLGSKPEIIFTVLAVTSRLITNARVTDTNAGRVKPSALAVMPLIINPVRPNSVSNTTR